MISEHQLRPTVKMATNSMCYAHKLNVQCGSWMTKDTMTAVLTTSLMSCYIWEMLDVHEP